MARTAGSTSDCAVGCCSPVVRFRTITVPSSQFPIAQHQRDPGAGGVGRLHRGLQRPAAVGHVGANAGPPQFARDHRQPKGCRRTHRHTVDLATALIADGRPPRPARPASSDRRRGRTRCRTTTVRPARPSARRTGRRRPSPTAHRARGARTRRSSGCSSQGRAPSAGSARTARRGRPAPPAPDRSARGRSRRGDRSSAARRPAAPASPAACRPAPAAGSAPRATGSPRPGRGRPGRR